ncbi:MAG TPA: cytochrome c oxidase subunit I, partial [Longimicrobiales bacterium]|nr:cytochrome c oxidase subunit I [Longimicrobiales bacterium]
IHHGHAHSAPQKKYSGIRDWLTTIDHKKIGILYFVTAFIFMIFGGLEALMIRIQLSRPENAFVSAETYNQLFTMHGTTMVFMVGMPIAVALFNYIVPLQIGARDVAFPRLNALSYWVFLFAALFMNFSWFLGMAPNGGWFGYANLTAKQYSPGPNIDFWALGLQAMGAASIMGGVNFITTIINLRAPGMKLMRMPLFTWMAFITSALLVTALPVFAVALFELTFDRAWGTNFFNVNAGGDPIVWQHLFWMFGHPEVYILILPGFGIVSEVIPTFSRKPLFGYAVMVYSAALIGLIGWGVWSHHMFAVGLGPIADAFFTVSTMIIAIPTGVKVFNWVATMWGGKIKFTTAMMFSVSFVALFTIGGISGMMHATSPHDLQQTDTYFVVAHFHYVLIGGLINGVFAGIFYWFPKVTGRMMNETLGKAFFWVFFVGMNLTFMPMHWTGLLGMPRRVFTYSPDLGVTHLNQLSTLGGGIQAIGFLLLIANILYSLKRGPKAPNNPWNAATLEWATTSPPVEYNFARIPTITTREPLWLEREQVEAAAFGTPEPMHMPPPSYWPILTAACVMITLMGFMVHVWWAPLIGLVLTMLMVINWAFEPVH